MDLASCILYHHISGTSLDKSTCIVGERGLKSLINASLQRDDGPHDFFENNLEEMQQGGSCTLKLYKVCRK